MTTQLSNFLSNYAQALLYYDLQRNRYRIICRNRYDFCILYCFVLKVRAAVSKAMETLNDNTIAQVFDPFILFDCEVIYYQNLFYKIEN